MLEGFLNKQDATYGIIRFLNWSISMMTMPVKYAVWQHIHS